MKALEPLYHHYELAYFETPGRSLHVEFIHKEGEPLATVSDGTTNEEVLAMLIHRLVGLNSKLPDDNTALAIGYCKSALSTLNKRTAQRKARGVEGTHKA